jgi:hypothetical protein
MYIVPTSFIPFADCAEVVVQGQSAGQAAYLTMGFLHPGGIVGSDLGDLADIVASWVTGTLLANLHAGYQVDSIKASQLDTVSSPVYVSVLGLPAAGAVGGAALTNQNAFVISFKTASRGRSYRGRNYIPGIPPAGLATPTSYTPAEVAAQVGAYNQLALDVSADGWVPVVLSRFNGGAPRAVGVATPITQYIGRTAVGTQRRRVIGHGI